MMTRVGDDFSHKVSTVVLLSRCRCLANGGRLGICSVFRGPLDPHVWTRITLGTATDTTQNVHFVMSWDLSFAGARSLGAVVAEYICDRSWRFWSMSL